MKFIKSFRNTNIHSDSIWVPSNEIFEVDGEEFYYEGYEYRMKIKSELKQISRNKDIYEISLKLAFADDADILHHGETVDIDVGVMIEPHGTDENGELLNLMKQPNRDKQCQDSNRMDKI